MKKILSILCLISIAFATAVPYASAATSTDTVPEAEAAPTTKMVGYIPCYRSLEQIDATVDFNQYSHVNYFSLQPMPDGTLQWTSGGSPEHLQGVVERAHAADTDVLIAIGGWGLSSGFSGATSPQNVDKFVANIVEFVETYNLDGVDIDWEYPTYADVDNFIIFMEKLDAAMPDDKSISVCVPSGVDSSGAVSGDWANLYPSEALNHADWINIMAYDAQVPGSPHHSPYEIVENSLNYWDSILNPGQNDMSKLVIGVPFYAKSEWGNTLMYSQIAAVNPDAINTDIYNDGTGNYYYNGGPTLEAKVTKALEMGAGGMMVWEPTQDAPLTDPSMRLTNVMIQTITDLGYVLDKGPQVPDTEAPTAPTDLVAVRTNDTSVSLSWTPSTDNVGIKEYEIYRDGVKVGTSTGATYTNARLTPNTTYSYYVKAVDTSGNVSAPSNTITITTLPEDVIAPTVPTDLVSTSNTDTTVNLSWTPSTDNNAVKRYYIYRNGELVGMSNTTTFVDEELTPSTTYTYTVRAVDMSGNLSEHSSPISVTTDEGQYPEWDPNSHVYTVGDIVTYKGKYYECIQSHTSNPGWAPDVAFTLWQEIPAPLE